MTNTASRKPVVVHIHGQYASHDQATIVATREALERLQQAINRMISSPKDEVEIVVDDLMCIDGEGFHLKLKMTPESKMERDHLPYSVRY